MRRKTFTEKIRSRVDALLSVIPEKEMGVISHGVFCASGVIDPDGLASRINLSVGGVSIKAEPENSKRVAVVIIDLCEYKEDSDG